MLGSHQSRRTLITGFAFAAMTILTPFAHAADGEGIHGMWGTEITAKLRPSPPSDEMKNVIWDLEKAIPIPFHTLFELHAAGDWAEMGAIAVFRMPGYHRIIYYGKGLEVQFQTGDPEDKWDAYMVLLHEIGHHLYQHTFTNRPTPIMELEADRFAACIVGMLGATQADATRIYERLASQTPIGTHPGRAARIEQVVAGWEVGSDDSIDRARCTKMPKLR
jgi:hypothetical protein